jgi:hypothetical protein
LGHGKGEGLRGGVEGMRGIAALLVAIVALAGCAAGSEENPVPSAAALSSSGSSAAPAPVPPPPAVYTGVCEDSAGISYGLPNVGGSGEPAVCPFATALAGDLSVLQGAVIEVVWTPGPTMTGAQLLIQSDSCWQGTRLGASGPESKACDQGNLQGATSPLRLEVAAVDLAEYGRDNLTAMVLAHGATTSQAFTIYVTLFEATPPPGFTALAV